MRTPSGCHGRADQAAAGQFPAAVREDSSDIRMLPGLDMVAQRAILPQRPAGSLSLRQLQRRSLAPEQHEAPAATAYPLVSEAVGQAVQDHARPEYENAVRHIRRWLPHIDIGARL